ncbi:MAG: type VI secretion system ATPase TssH, partial [Ruminococcus sp.]|nr:type VI secretion system ATPase TssH [Ruminococcus sp.]
CHRQEMLQMPHLLLQRVSNRRAEDKHLKLTVSDVAKAYLIDTGYDSNYGARPLKRVIQSKLEVLVARKIIADDPMPETEIKIDYDGNKLFAVSES